jgi:hypothetical protein
MGQVMDHINNRRLRIRRNSGAGEESRTLDLNLGKVARYQLSYSRMESLPYYTLHQPTPTGAGEESRTLDLNLGKVALYQLSYSRVQDKHYRRLLAFLQHRLLCSVEREKSLELSTSTLARLRSTN